MVKVITSAQNPLIKNIVALLEKARERRQQERIVAEGLYEVRLALVGGWPCEHLLYNPQLTTAAHLEPLLVAAPHLEEVAIEVNGAVMEKIAYRHQVPNVVAVLRAKNQPLEAIDLPTNPLVLVLEKVEKPGNLGAILRTADAAGVDAVLLCDPQTDWFNPNVIRASLGAVFQVPLASAPAAAALDWLRQKGLAIVVTDLQAATPYCDTNLNQPLAIVLGTEADGISPWWRQAATIRVIIPMRGRVDSLNVSVSTGILLFEALRQRRLASS